jgi:phage shock protein PspC (stress-responsive transcriptional regulator)
MGRPDARAQDVAMTDSEPIPLRRPHEGRILAGVTAGVAEYFGVDVAVVRIVAVVLTLLGGIGIPAYLAGWLLIPDECASESLVEEWLDRPRHAA